MAVSKIGIDFSSLDNVSEIEFTVPNSTKDIFDGIREVPNQITGGWLGYGMIITIFITVFSILSDRTPFGNFGYDNLRALALTLGICSVFSMVLLNLNFITNILIMSLSVFLFMLTIIIIKLTEASP